MCSKNKDNALQKGIALIIVLWVLTILMVIVLSFSYITRIESHAALSFRQGIEKRFLAEAGVERGIIEVFYRKKIKSSIEDREVWRVDCTPYLVKTDNGYYTVGITDETGKVDINRASEVILKNLFRNIGIDIKEVDTIVDSIMDWKDADDLHRLHGVESDYYMSLPNPYKAKNADFDTLEELILVKGVTRKILYGDEEKRGIIDFLTVNSKTSKINISVAPKEVLMAIPGISSEIADIIISLRENGETNKIQEVLGQGYSIITTYINLSDSDTFTIDAFGHKYTDESGYGIRAVVKIYGNTYKYLYYKSPAH